MLDLWQARILKEMARCICKLCEVVEEAPLVLPEHAELSRAVHDLAVCICKATAPAWILNTDETPEARRDSGDPTAAPAPARRASTPREVLDAFLDDLSANKDRVKRAAEEAREACAASLEGEA